VKVKSIDTTEQPVDILTKASAHDRFCEMHSKIGLVELVFLPDHPTS
jgi:hypothetical protein